MLFFILPVILQKYPRVRFYVYGCGPKMSLLRTIVDEYNLGDRVDIYEGYVKMTEIPSTLAKHDIILITSLTESFCLLILEAIACGLYVISTG